jgi:hypothetical protein
MPYGQPPTYVALESIGRAISSLSTATGTITEISPYGNATRITHRTDPGVERDTVREALIGAAFALAQAHLVAVNPKNAAQQAVCHVANYWKHRDQWDAQWTASGPNAGTINAVRSMGAAPPTALGQLTQLAEVALGGPFTWEALWRAIE